MTKDKVIQFLNGEQRDPRLNEILFPFYDHERVQQLIAKYEADETYVAQGSILFLMRWNNFEAKVLHAYYASFVQEKCLEMRFSDSYSLMNVRRSSKIDLNCTKTWINLFLPISLTGWEIKF